MKVNLAGDDVSVLRTGLVQHIEEDFKRSIARYGMLRSGGSQ